MDESYNASCWVVVNSFEELKPTCIEEYAKIMKTWCIGPVSLIHKNELHNAERGNKASIDEQQCLRWLDSQETKSVIYACLGSSNTLKYPELKELGLGLEVSRKPLIWVLKGNNEASNKVIKWIKEDGLTKGRGLIIMGWAPQVLILSHPAVGPVYERETCGTNVEHWSERRGRYTDDLAR
ncbi:UDP-glycosyltransferase 73C1-like [Hibiscus syriacus]|uniref:UDP-glycosyltransferase 73C1-like n=1 Tax=Hibiscus syriacus TaxID=106335 RepID=UPI001924D2D7|nr:UDP-glycosyltransferase 73C1-like [Hibiscus syriacus]